MHFDINPWRGWVQSWSKIEDREETGSYPQSFNFLRGKVNRMFCPSIQQQNQHNMQEVCSEREALRDSK